MNKPDNKVADAGTVDELCEILRKRWEKEDRVSIEDLVCDSKLPLAEPSLLLRLIQVELELRRQKGESISAKEFIDRFPQVDPGAIRDLAMLPAPPPPEHKGPLLPSRYRPIKEVGRGGIGSVWRVFDKTLERPLAVKVLHDRYRNDEGANARMDVEALLTGVLQHPGIPPIHDRGVLVSGSSFFAMKLVEGETLAAILSHTDVLEHQSQLLGTFEQVAQTIAYAHSQRVIHRDLKPSNIMVGEFGEVQVMDWGLAKNLTDLPVDQGPAGHAEANEKGTDTKETFLRANDSTLTKPERNLTRQGDVIGTLAYMAPEQARGDLLAINESCDIFSLGAILLEILTGKPLYAEVSLDQLLESAASGALEASLKRLDDSSADPELKRICRKCIEPNPVKRAPSATWIVEEIQSYLESVETRLREAELSRSRVEVKVAEERKRKRLAYVLNGFIIVAVGAAFLAAIWYQKEQERRRVEKARDRAETLVTSLSSVPMDALPIAIGTLDEEYAIDFLERESTANKDRPDIKQRYEVALAFLGKPRSAYLARQLATVPIEDFSLICQAMSFDENSIEFVKQGFDSAKDLDLQTRYSLCAAYLGKPDILNGLLEDLVNVDARCAIIDECSHWKFDFEGLMEAALEKCDSAAQYALLCGIAEVPERRIGIDLKQKWSSSLGELYVNASRAEIRAVAELLLKRWKQPLPLTKIDKGPVSNRNWYRNPANMVMVKVTGYESAQLASGGYDFYISDREVSVKQVSMFLEEDKAAAEYVPKLKGDSKSTYKELLARNLRYNKLDPGSEDSPIRYFGFYPAIRFCNWLSREEGLEPFYIDQNDPEQAKSIKTPAREKWSTNPLANGYRLPDNFEWRKVQKPYSLKGYMTAAARYHPRFAWYLKNAFDPQPTATRLPNILGLFDLSGNLSEMGHFQSEADHRHSLLGGSYRSIDIRDLQESGIAHGSTFFTSAPFTGFRVVRLDRPAAKAKHINQLRLDAHNAKKNSRNESLSLEKTLAICQELLQLQDYSAGTYRLIETINKDAYQLVKTKKSPGKGYQVQSSAYFTLARISFERQNYELASRQMGNAKSCLTQAHAWKALDSRAHQKIQREMLEFESRLNVKRAFEMATHWDIQRRRTRSAYFMALQSIEYLGETDGMLLADYAAVLAAEKKYAEAVRVQKKAIGLMRMADVPPAWQERVRLYRESRAFVQEKPSGKK